MQEQSSVYNSSKTSGVVTLLKELIAVPSFSREEEKTAKLLTTFFEEKNIPVHRNNNNIWTVNACYDPKLPTILLNSHHDTVKPNPGYTLDPFTAIEKEGKIYGLGANDAGGALVSLIAVFLHFYNHRNLRYNLILAATAEEEISGKNGMECVLPLLGTIAFAIVGEPTGMQMAVAEKGLLVLDCLTKGRAGHAARNEGENAIYKALADIEWFRNHRFERNSEWLGELKMTVTMIQAGLQHNVIPGECRFTVDIRTNECYPYDELLATIRQHVSCEVLPRSERLKPSFIPADHALYKAGAANGLKMFGSPTLSDQALLPFPSVKIGPGDSARSHTADEYIVLDEIHNGIPVYINLLNEILFTQS